jgi:hypothetical protein
MQQVNITSEIRRNFTYFLEYTMHLKKPLTKYWGVWLIHAQTLVTLLSFAI